MSSIPTTRFLATLVLLSAITPAVLAENRISVGYAEGAPGDRAIPILITATNDVPIHGYSIALTFPTPILRLASLSIFGTNVAGLEPDFVAPRIDNVLGLATLGVIFSFSEPVVLSELPPTPDGNPPRIIARTRFDILGGATGGEYPIRLEDGIGSPASYNRFTSTGQTITPALDAGVLAVTGGNIVELEKKIAFAGATPNLRIFALASHARPLDGFQIAFRYEKAALTLTESTFNGTSMFIELGAARIESFNFDLDEDFSSTHARATAAALFDSSPPFDGQVLSPSTDEPLTQSIVRYTFNVHGEADDEKEYQDLILEDVGVPGAIDNRFFIDARSLDPVPVHGKVYFSTGGITGTVIEAESGVPVSGVTVQTVPDAYTTTTDFAGRFQFTTDTLPAGSYALKFAKPGFYGTRAGERVVDGKGGEEDFGTVVIYQIPESPSQPFLRAEVNGDGKVDLSDAISLLNFLFQSAGDLLCLSAGDINDDDSIDISDSVFLLNFLFLGGPRPRAPFDLEGNACDLDPTPGGGLNCEEFECRN